MLSMKSIFDRKFNIKALCVALGMMMFVPAYASISVSPMKIEIDANKVRNNYYTTAITIKGDPSKALRFKAYPGYFKISKDSKLISLDSSNDPHDVSKKVRFVPSEFAVAPGRTQKVRINVAGIKNLPDGENRAVLYIEDVNPKEVNLDTGNSNIGAQLIVKTRVAIPIYIDSGKYTKLADIEYLKVNQAKDGIHTEMKILSQGNSKIRYSLKAQILQGKDLVDECNLNGKVVADNSAYIDKQVIKTDKIKNSGMYTLRMIVSYENEKGRLKYIKKETNINIVGKM